MKTTNVKDKRTSTVTARKTTARRAGASEVIDLVPALVKMESILVPIDFSATSKKALVYATRMAEQFGAKVILLHVVEPIATPDLAYHPLMLEPEKAKQAAKEGLDKLCRQLRLSAPLLDRTMVRFGTPFAEITGAARTLKVDLIVLTTHGYTGLKHVFMGSTAERVVRHAPCPVLTVRDKERDFV